MAKTIVKVDVAAEKLIPEINANHRECIRSGREALKHAQQAGELLWKLKESLAHGQFEEVVEGRLDFALTIAKGYMKVSEGLPRLLEKLGNEAPPEISIRGAIKLIDEHNPKKKKAPPKRASIGDAPPILLTPGDGEIDLTVCAKDGGAHGWIADDDNPGEECCGKCGEPRDSRSSPGWGTSKARPDAWKPPEGVKAYKDSFDVAVVERAKPANGKPKHFDDNGVRELYGKLIRKLDDRASTMGGNEGSCRKMLSESYSQFLTWSGLKK